VTGVASGAESAGAPPVASNVTWHQGLVARSDRPGRGATIWFTAVAGAGMPTVAGAVARARVAAGGPAYLLDGDNLRHGLNGDLGFSATDRTENIRRVGEVARLFADAGVVALVPVISPYRADRDRARQIHEAVGLRFLEVWVDTPLDVCEERDPKGLYAKARAGEIKGFTGIDDPYEAPEHPDVRLTPADGDPAAQTAKVLALL
jgi:bifunctional enzyme CysN/CysC